MPVPNPLVGGNVILNRPSTINIVVGRNGVGKSRMLQALYKALYNDANTRCTYVSPERGGAFENEAGVDNASQDPNWNLTQRAKNQATNFKQSSAASLRRLEILWSRKALSDPAIRASTKTFQSEIIDKINELLINVKMEQTQTGGTPFQFTNLTGNTVPPGELSSGESEVMALGSELLYFFNSLDSQKLNVLIIDEPDVHLHPDLQILLATFILNQLNSLENAARDNIAVVIATHSTPLITALTQSPLVRVGTKQFGSDQITFRDTSSQFRKTSRFFAHPLSQVISEEPLMIMEGEDDARVFQHAARSAPTHQIKVFPCVAGSKQDIGPLEDFCRDMLESLYQNPIAYSIYDGDGRRTVLPKKGCVTRFKLQCYEIENLLVTDECLRIMNTDWPQLQTKINAELATGNFQSHATLLSRLAASTDRLRDIKLKDIRSDLCGILDIKKPWEQVIGQGIASLPPTLPATPAANSIQEFFGTDALKAIGFQ